MGFAQENHQAGDPHINLSKDQANRLADLFEDYKANANDDDVEEALDNILETLGQIADGDDDATMSPDTASAAAAYIRKREGEEGGEHETLVKALDSVAKQHDVSGGKTIATDSASTNVLKD